MTEPTSKPQNPVLMAVIGAAHGIKGELRVKTFTDDPLALGGYGSLFAKDGRRFDILDIRPQGTVVVVRFKGVGDRSAAEALTGTELFVDRAALAADLDDEEFYHADLVGLSVVDEQGAQIGKVAAVHNFGAGDILEISGPGLSRRAGAVHQSCDSRCRSRRKNDPDRQRCGRSCRRRGRRRRTGRCCRPGRRLRPEAASARAA